MDNGWVNWPGPAGLRSDQVVVRKKSLTSAIALFAAAGFALAACDDPDDPAPIEVNPPAVTETTESVAPDPDELEPSVSVSPSPSKSVSVKPSVSVSVSADSNPDSENDGPNT